MHPVAGVGEEPISEEGTGTGEDADIGVVIDALADTGADVAGGIYTVWLTYTGASGLSASPLKAHSSVDTFLTLDQSRC